MGDFICAPSAMCLDLARLEDELRALEAAGADEIHFDIMDGVFVPNYTLGFDFIKAAKRCTSLPCSAHLMIVRPERYIERFAEAGCDYISVHVEAGGHAHRLLGQIRDTGAVPGISINPATPLTRLNYLLPEAERVLMMTVDPGYAGQTIIPNAFERVRILRQVIDYHKYKTQIEVDGNIDVANCAKLKRMGAEIFVLGTASICKGPGSDYAKALPEFRQAVLREEQMV